MVLLGVVGASSCSPRIEQVAYEVGREIAASGAGLICGGLGGVMQAACKGARDGGAATIGVLPGNSAAHANPYVDWPIVTGLGEARNLVIVKSAACLIAISGEYGTLSEVAFALKMGVPVVGIESWDLTLPDGGKAPLHAAADARSAVQKAISLLPAAVRQGLRPTREASHGN